MNLLEHALNANQVMAENFFGHIKQLEDAFVADRVVDVGAVLASHHDIPIAQHCELL
jgi:hypothetical protein